MFTGILVRISQDQYQRLYNLVSNLQTPDGSLGASLPREIEIYIPENFEVGQEVGITFGYSGPIEQFFMGTAPFALIGVTADPDRLEHEILPTQLQFAGLSGN